MSRALGAVLWPLRLWRILSPLPAPKVGGRRWEGPGPDARCSTLLLARLPGWHSGHRGPWTHPGPGLATECLVRAPGHAGDGETPWSLRSRELSEAAGSRHTNKCQSRWRAAPLGAKPPISRPAGPIPGPHSHRGGPGGRRLVRGVCRAFLETVAFGLSFAKCANVSGKH